MTLRVMIVDPDTARSAVLEQALRDAGHQVIARLADDNELATAVAQHQPDIIIIDQDAPGRDTLEGMRQINRENPKPIIMFSDQRDPDYIRQAVQAGVSAYVVDGMAPDRVMPIVEVAMARFREFQALKRELEVTKIQLADRKIIERAKGVLMERKGMTEDEAYRFLRKTAMSHNSRVAEVAKLLLSLEGMLS